MWRFGAGGIFSALRTRRIVEALTLWPSLSSSPWIRWYPSADFGGELLDQRSEPGTDRRSSYAARIDPPLGDQATMPPQDGSRRDQPVHLCVPKTYATRRYS